MSTRLNVLSERTSGVSLVTFHLGLRDNIKIYRNCRAWLKPVWSAIAGLAVCALSELWKQNIEQSTDCETQTQTPPSASAVEIEHNTTLCGNRTYGAIDS